MSDENKANMQNNGDPENTVTVKTIEQQPVKEKVVVIENGDPENTVTVDYKKEYSELLLTNALKESKSMQALDLPQAIALEYFKKYFTIEDDKGKLSIVGRFNDSKLVNKEGEPISVDEVIKHIISNDSELRKQAVKKAPTYKGAIGAASVDIKNMSISEKIAYRKQVGPAVFRSILEKRK